MNAHAPPKPLQPDQAAAVDPQIHATLSASAGTGKTQVLTARVLRLLLAGAFPETILCLTFTKAAAAEMAERINVRLARWVRLNDTDLTQELEAIGIAGDAAMLARARQLFAAVLDCPGGMRVQTIHSFCQTLLSTFPAEAGITPGFRPVEGREEIALVERTLASLAEQSAATDGAFLADLEILAGRMSERGVRDYLKDCATSEILRQLPPIGIEPWLRRQVELPEGDIQGLVAGWCDDTVFDCGALRSLSDGYRAWGKVSGAPLIEKIESWLAMAPDERCRKIGLVHSVLFTDKGRRVLTKGLIEAHPTAQEDCDALAEAVGELVSLLRRDELVRLQAAGLRAGALFADAYASAKRAAGVADFDDLIRWSRDLLHQPGIADWVRFKLDRRTDHLLVDEAQDTNAAQWSIVKALAEEFWAGQGAGGDHRTLFMVGDFKQAIYGFQGTDPAEFESAQAEFRDLAKGGPRPFRDLSISASFRSSQVVLDTVDKVLELLGPDALGLPAPARQHRAFHAERPGRVELWPPFQRPQAEPGDAGDEGWENEEKRHFARHIAERIKALIDEAPVLASTGRPLTAGDILVLVRSRASGLAGLLVGRLFERGVPIAGLDRLELSEPLAVQDLLAAMRFAVQPLDSLSLANLLVSPLGGWSQDDLYALARRERGISLWEELGRRRTENAQFTATRTLLEGLLREADFVGPYAFLERILSGPMEGRRKLLSRLGKAARDPINELLAAALTFEAQENGGLQRFLHWFASGKVEVKRDPEAGGDAVRIMTVHGAKGLEAPVVFLVDATSDPGRSGGFSPPLWYAQPGGKVPLIRPRKAELCPPFDAIIDEEKAANLREHHRLGYVALTRAAERLVIAGLRPNTKEGKLPDQCWHRVVGDALAGLGAVTTADGSLVLEQGTVVPITAPQAVPSPDALAVVPDWASTPAPIEARPPRPLAPSQVAADTDSRPPPTPALAAAAERGRLLHALFERLPATPQGDRRSRAFAWLQQSAGVTDAELRSQLVDSALAIIEAPEHADLFSPAALAEAPIAATLPDGTVVAGTVDRLLVTDEVVRVVDFKTGRQVPGGAASIPSGHLRQMRAYGQALQVIFPDRRIELALLYTEAPLLLSVPLEDLSPATHMVGNPNQEQPTP